MSSLSTEHKRPSVICAALMNRSTSSAKSKTRGHGPPSPLVCKSLRVSGRHASRGTLSERRGPSRVAGGGLLWDTLQDSKKVWEHWEENIRETRSWFNFSHTEHFYTPDLWMFYSSKHRESYCRVYAGMLKSGTCTEFSRGCFFF